MAESKKKTVAAKTVKTETAAPAEVKADAVETKEEVKTAVKKETKTATKKAPAKKTSAKKTTAKKAESAEPKAAKADTAVNMAVHFQFSGKSYSTEDLQKIAKDVWKYDLHKEEEEYASLELYVKPEESIVYYVFNGDITGSFFI